VVLGKMPTPSYFLPLPLGGGGNNRWHLLNPPPPFGRGRIKVGEGKT